MTYFATTRHATPRRAIKHFLFKCFFHGTITASFCLLLLFSMSVTRLGDLLHFGQLFKACGNNIFPKSPTLQVIFVKVSKSFIVLVKSFLGNFNRYLATFYWSRCFQQQFTENFQTSAGFELGSSDQKASMLTTRPPPRPKYSQSLFVPFSSNGLSGIRTLQLYSDEHTITKEPLSLLFFKINLQ